MFESMLPRQQIAKAVETIRRSENSSDINLKITAPIESGFFSVYYKDNSSDDSFLPLIRAMQGLPDSTVPVELASFGSNPRPRVVSFKLEGLSGFGQASLTRLAALIGTKGNTLRSLSLKECIRLYETPDARTKSTEALSLCLSKLEEFEFLGLYDEKEFAAATDFFSKLASASRSRVYPNLHNLSFTGTNLGHTDTSWFVDVFMACPSLKKLSLVDCHLSSSYGTQLSIADLFESCPSLESLDLSFNHFSMSSFTQSVTDHTRFHNLRELNLSDNRCLLDTANDQEAFIKFLENCPSLEKLSLERCNLGKDISFTARICSTLAKHCPKLQSIDLSGNELSDRLSLLLELGSLPLKHIGLIRCGFTDESATHLGILAGMCYKTIETVKVSENSYIHTRPQSDLERAITGYTQSRAAATTTESSTEGTHEHASSSLRV